MLGSSVLISLDILVFIFHKCFLLAEMTTKFNKDLYAKMRTKKDEPLSSLGKRTVRIIGKPPWLLHRPPSLPLSLVLRRWGRLLQPLRLKRSLLLPPKDLGWPTKGRRKPILVRLAFGMTRVWRWKRCTGSWLLRTWRPFLACPSMRLRLTMSTNWFS